MDYKSKLSENNTELQGVLDTIIALPTYDEGYSQCTADMQDDLQAKYSEGYSAGETVGYNTGLEAGAENLKTQEARTESDITVNGATVNVPSGYYSKPAEKTVDTQPFYDEGYSAGQTSGYTEGYSKCTEDMQDDLQAKYDDGIDVGKATIKTEEARDESDVVAQVWASDKNVEVRVTAGYYAEETIVNVDVTEVYEAGLTAGSGSSEDLEALGALCDWMVTTDSTSIATVTVCNYHPTYYLHCHIWAENSQIDIDNFVVAPDDCASVTFDAAFSLIQPIYVNDVRWTANA